MYVARLNSLVLKYVKFNKYELDEFRLCKL